MNRSEALKQAGQSIWYDNIERGMLMDGEMARMIKDGEVYGVTSNPSIFEKSISSSAAYDDILQSMAWAGLSKEQIYLELVREDIQAAADLFLPVYEATGGIDGMVSVEINPLFAYDTEKSIEDGRALWAQMNRKNVMIKVPATKAGLPVIETLISEGINVNATLIFSIPRYMEVMEAYFLGLEKRLANNLPIDHVTSVASFFVSRIDTLVDSRLEEYGAANPQAADQVAALTGKIAIDNARLAYQEFLKFFASERFENLKQYGAKVQRPLWASTSTKNKAYSETLYVDELVAPNSVNTIPPATLSAFLDHGATDLRIEQDLERARKDFDMLLKLGFDYNRIAQELEDEGVEKFKQAYISLLETIETKRAFFKVELANLGEAVHAALKKAADEVYVGSLFDHEPSFWTSDQSGHDEIRERLGWLSLPGQQFSIIDELAAFKEKLLSEGYVHAFVIGMGGSSLAPEVMSQAIAPVDGKGLKLQIIDTTSPDEIAFRVRGVDLRKSLFIVSSKSGGTSETMSAMKYFWAELEKIEPENVGKHFVAITDPNTSLQDLAYRKGFRKVFNARPDVGGRYSVFTHFGLVPAAVMGIDLHKLLGQGNASDLQSRKNVPYPANPNLMLGLVLGEAAKRGKDKLTFIAEGFAGSLVPWLEQLIAESSGKEGKGILPIENEPVLVSQNYPEDRIFVYFKTDGSKAGLVDELKQAGQIVITIAIPEPYALAKEFYRWEYATAIACAVLQVNAFDQPNVQLSKTITKDVIIAYQKSGKLEDGEPIWENDQAIVYGFRNEEALREIDLESLLLAYARSVPEKGYVVLSGFIPRLEENFEILQALRGRILNAVNKATTLGFGPRFLHSTGQLHKGGLGGGLFIHFTKDAEHDFEIPGEGMSFGTLQRAQALGDLQALAQKDRAAIRVHLKG
ncbi:MAG TPA: bifunctional transaldolase/phosoglucose isomerase [Anaerolineaceae bacterium]|nr:bifunctional transaldolase/phosoglucose isomerase [Anaerolineaceae bacterium]